MVKNQESLIASCAVGVKDKTQTITQPMPLDFLRLALASFFPFSVSILSFCLFARATSCTIPPFFCFQIRQKMLPPSPLITTTLCALSSSVRHSPTPILFDFLTCTNGGSEEVSKVMENMEDENMDSTCCVRAGIYL